MFLQSLDNASWIQSDAAIQYIELIEIVCTWAAWAVSMLGHSKSQSRTEKGKRARKLQSITSTLQKHTIVRLGEELTVLKRESSNTNGELSDVKLDNNWLLNIAQSATLDAYIATRTAENFVRKIVASASDRVVTSAQP